MPHYVDGYVVPVAKKKLAQYQRIAQKAAKIFVDLGALEYRECVGEHLDVPFGLPFPKGIRTKPGETVVFAYVVFKSRAHRDKVNAKIMKDPRMNALCDPGNMPFDCNRMLVGGFKTIAAA
jgi:uncharacterized protein YbaA (DUF1428 family)